MHVIVPIKRFSLAKQRLAEGLDAQARYRISEAMALWTLLQLSRSRCISGVLVVTSESSLKEQIRNHGFQLLDDPVGTGGLNAALSAAVAHLCASGISDVGIVHSDIPLFSTEEFDRIVSSHRSGRQRQMALLTDRYGCGTNIRFCRPAQMVPCQYGPDSALRHVSHARSAGVHVRHLQSATLELDLDHCEDIQAILAMAQSTAPSGLPPVVALLRQFELHEV